jgi:hypothetical protein
MTGKPYSLDSLLSILPSIDDFVDWGYILGSLNLYIEESFMGGSSKGGFFCRGHWFSMGLVNSTLVADAILRVCCNSKLSNLVSSVRMKMVDFWELEEDKLPHLILVDHPGEGSYSTSYTSAGYCFAGKTVREDGIVVERHLVLYQDQLDESDWNWCRLFMKTIRALTPQVCKDENRSAEALTKFLEILFRIHPDLEVVAAPVRVSRRYKRKDAHPDSVEKLRDTALF